jgi:hypothetical protein
MLLNIKIKLIQECSLILNFSEINAISEFKMFFFMNYYNFHIIFLALFSMLNMNEKRITFKNSEYFISSLKFKAR